MEESYINWIIGKNLPIYNIDKKDRQIITLISSNSRASLKLIAKKIGISKVAVLKRINKLENQKIINGYSCFIDFQKLGFGVYQAGIKTNMSESEKKIYLKKISQNPFVSQILSLSGGDWDYLIRFYVKKDVNEILELLDDENIEKIDIMQINSFVFFDNFIEKIIKSESDLRKIDKKDISLLYELAQNSKQTILHFSSKINLSTKQTMERIKKLKEEKIILSLSAYTNPGIYGDIGFLLLVKSKRKEQEKIINLLVKMNSNGGILNIQNPNILTVHSIGELKQLNLIEDSLFQFRDYIKSRNFVRIEEQIYYNFFPKGVYRLLLEQV